MMAKILQLTAPGRVNPALLHEELTAVLGASFGGLLMGDDEVRAVLLVTTDEDAEALRPVCQDVLGAHDPDAKTAEQQSYEDFLTAWRNGVLAGKTPAQIYEGMTTQINGWASLANAKADLRDWLPLIGAALWYLLRGELDL